MGVTIHVNGKSNSLVHKGSMGIAKSTIPDVCKTPSPGGPVPIPYPVIISMSNSLAKGTKTVKVDGKKMAAVKGSEFSRCNGDEPGTAGGVKSSTNMKEATWLLYSFDVKLDGKNACRLSDKMMMNHGNTVCLSGEQQMVVLSFDQAKGLLCQIFCECKSEAQARKFETPTDPFAFDEPDFGADAGGPGRAMNQACVERKLRQDYSDTNLVPEQSYDMTTSPPSPVSGRPQGSRRPDIVRIKGPSAAPLQAPNIDVFEMKFPGDSYGDGQEEAYEEIGGGQPVTTLDSDECGC